MVVNSLNPCKQPSVFFSFVFPRPVLFGCKKPRVFAWPVLFMTTKPLGFFLTSPFSTPRLYQSVLFSTRNLGFFLDPSLLDNLHLSMRNLEFFSTLLFLSFLNTQPPSARPFLATTTKPRFFSRPFVGVPRLPFSPAVSSQGLFWRCLLLAMYLRFFDGRLIWLPRGSGSLNRYMLIAA